MPAWVLPEHFQQSHDLYPGNGLLLPFTRSTSFLSQEAAHHRPPALHTPPSHQDTGLFSPLLTAPSHWGLWIVRDKWAPRHYHSPQGCFSSNMKIIARAVTPKEPHMGSHSKGRSLVYCGQRLVIFPGKGFPRRGGVGFWLICGLIEIQMTFSNCGNSIRLWKRGPGSNNATSRGC